MTTAQRNQRRATPRAGTRQSVRIDDQLADDLAVMMTTGCDLSAAVRTAVSIVATMYRTAWHHQSVPVGTEPTLAAFRFVEGPPAPGPEALPWVTGSSLTSADDGRRQLPPTPPPAAVHPTAAP
ncbi:hypothetical protein ABT234_05145 [Streptomyces sp. NPDC001586]|uniref:hypothetical protein n=1 Tax=unclassified Streptomyces TaxID=2593676 RepID=UPI00332CF248